MMLQPVADGDIHEVERRAESEAKCSLKGDEIGRKQAREAESKEGETAKGKCYVYMQRYSTTYCRLTYKSDE